MSATTEMADPALIRCARDAEDVAAGLHAFRDSLPRSATRITAVISKLFAISSVLREVDQEQADPSFYRVQNDLGLVLPTLGRTLDNVFDMFRRSRERPHQMVWDDLGHRMEREEGIGLLGRLEWYHDFLGAQLDVLTGRQPHDLRLLRRQLVTLLDAQEVAGLRAQRRSIDASGMRLTCAPAAQAWSEVRLTET